MSPGPVRILLVDDSATARYTRSRWLRRGGCVVTEAATGAEALTRICAEPVDVVVLDVRLPDIDGFEVCERIKGEPDLAALPVVHVSAVYVEVTDRTQGLTRGADAYLVEPVDPDELLATVHAVLRHSRARQRAERKAGRLALMVELAAELNAVESFAACLRAAAAGTARLFDRPAAVTTVTPDGTAVTADIGGPTGAAVIAANDPPAGRWPVAATSAEVRSVVAQAKDGDAPVRVAVRAAWLDDDDAAVLGRWAQTVAAALEAARARDVRVTVPGRSGWEPLTPREREIAVLVAAGHTNQKIAALLMIAKRTVDAHLAHIMGKLGFGSRTQIAAWVVELRATTISSDTAEDT